MISILALLAIGASSASALSYQTSATIPWAPLNSTSVDQSVIYNGTYYVADRTNKGVQVIDLASNKQVTVIGGFQGLATLNSKPNTAESGPDGLLVLPDRKELYVGDGSGSIKIIDLTTNSMVANISVNSTERADEMGYDPETHIVVCTIPNETPPRVAVISATNRTVNGYITFNNASGLEQPAWDSVSKQFYISVPSTGANPGGEIAIIDVNTFNITRILPLSQCVPAGIVFGPNRSLFVSCSQTQILSYNISSSLVLNVTTGNVIANISGVSGVDQVTYDSNAGFYYASAYQNLAGGSSTGAPQPLLAIIDANTNTLFQTIPTDNVTAHSVAVDPTNNNFVVPLTSMGLVVYSLNNSTANSTSGSSTSGSSTSGSSTSSSSLTSSSSTTSPTSGANVSKTAIHAVYYVGLALFAGTMLS
ncbi:YVTN repeat-like/Quino protein amine dehydrogenase [Phlegmacium glaucopus]|nr:YVTN repeat-like/Quino protein amine dehydrogenase [Phlegmacium glaucopus]